MLANRSTPTEAERSAVIAVSRAFQACNQYAVKKVGPMPS
jgi:cytochrome c551/c552